jgi:hypothetical protein
MRWSETPTARTLGINDRAVNLMCAMAEASVPLRLDRRDNMYARQMHDKVLVRKEWHHDRFAGWVLTSKGRQALKQMGAEARG